VGGGGGGVVHRQKKSCLKLRKDVDRKRMFCSNVSTLKFMIVLVSSFLQFQGT